MQKYSSKDTSLNTINKAYKQCQYESGSTILDYGGGKYDKNKEYMASMGCTLIVYDKYNRSSQENEAALALARQGVDYVVCSNVLNVIMEDDIIDDIIADIASFKPKKKIIFVIYEGNKSGTGRETTKGWQRHQKTADYIPAISKYFHVLKKRGNIIETCMKS